MISRILYEILRLTMMIELFYTVFLQRLLCLWKNFVFNFHMISKIIEYYEVKIIRYCLNCSIIPLWNAGWKGIYTRSPYKLNFNHELTWKVMVMQNKSKNNRSQTTTNCARCGKVFGKKEMKVSYDFERFYCFRCDDER